MWNWVMNMKLHYLCNFSVNLKFFQNKKFILFLFFKKLILK